MKKLIICLLSISFVLFNIPNAIASFDTEEEQLTPEGFNYQAIARDVKGNPMVNKEISVRISMFNGEDGSFVEYTETHKVKTDEFGQFSIVIGRGLKEKGDFMTIPWGNSNQWMQLEMDPDGGEEYVLLGKTQLLSVPYALYAKESGSLNGKDDRNDPDDWTMGGNAPSSAALSVLGTTNSKSLSIRTKDTDRIHIKGTSGKVGIGTTAPSEKLHVEGKVVANAFYIKPAKLARFLRIEDGGANDQSLYFQNQYQGVTINIGGTTNANSPIDPADLMLFKVRKGSDVKLLIDGDGNVGIGTTDPQYELDVAGTIRSVSDNDSSSIAIYGKSSQGRAAFLEGHLDVYGDTRISTSGDTALVVLNTQDIGIVANADHSGVEGFASHDGGMGVYGRSDSSNSVGVMGYSSYGNAVYGWSDMGIAGKFHSSFGNGIEVSATYGDAAVLYGDVSLEGNIEFQGNNNWIGAGSTIERIEFDKNNGRIDVRSASIEVDEDSWIGLGSTIERMIFSTGRVDVQNASVEIDDGEWIGIGSTVERIEFDATNGRIDVRQADIEVDNGTWIGIGNTVENIKFDGTNDVIEMNNANVLIEGNLMVDDTVQATTYYGDGSNLTGIVSGAPTGTAGQTMYHDGNDWSATSNLYNDGNNIGIGTTTPSSMYNIEVDASGYNIAIHATSDLVGVHAEATGGGGTGVYGYASDDYGTGIYGLASGDNSVGVEGIANGLNSYAGKFTGNVSVSSNLMVDTVHANSLMGDGSGITGIDASQISGLDSSGPVGSSGQTLYHDGNEWIGASNLYNDGNSIGIGTTTPSSLYNVDIDASGFTMAIHAVSSTVGLHGEAVGGGGMGVYGGASEDYAYGVYGYASGEYAHGVYGGVSDPTGYAGYFSGRVYVNDDLDVGGALNADSISVNATGSYDNAITASTYAGDAIIAESNSGIAIYGKSANGFAGYFDGTVSIFGELNVDSVYAYKLIGDGSGITGIDASQIYGLYTGPSGSAGQTMYHDGNDWAGTSNIFNDGANIGIGTTTPNTNYNIDIDASGFQMAIHAVSSLVGVHSEATGPQGVGVYASTIGDNGVGVQGVAYSGANQKAVQGIAYDTSSHAGYFEGKVNVVGELHADYISSDYNSTMYLEVDSIRANNGGDIGVVNHLSVTSLTTSSSVEINAVDEVTGLDIDHLGKDSTVVSYGLNVTADGGGASFSYGIVSTATGGTMSDYAGYFNGDVHATGDITWVSDPKLKSNINDYLSNEALKKLLKLKVKSYDFKTEEFDFMHLPKGNQLGFLTSDLEEEFPSLVKKTVTFKPNKEKLEYNSLNYTGLIPVTVSAIQEQQKIIEQLKQQLEQMERRIEELEKE